MTAVPHYLRPKATRLPEGHDDTLDPPEEPTDASERTLAPGTWPAVNTAAGPDGPPESRAAPPPTDPGERVLAPFSWPTLGPASPNRPMRETAPHMPDLDPDIAMWPAVQVSIWPFTGTPPVGIWPTGWFGIDNRGVPYVCIAGGQPGTWQALTPGGGTNANALQGTPINAVGPTAGQSLVFDGTQWTPQNVSTPVGVIEMWGTAPIPGNWLALNGQTVTGGATNFPALAALYPAWVSGTNLILPDYRNRFAVGGGNQYAVGSTGGAASATLTTAQIPQFNPSVSFGGSTSVESAAHNHAFPNTNIVTEAASTLGIVASPTVQTLGIQDLITSSENVNHTHNMSGVTGSVTFGNASPAAVATLPPYFGINFIIKAA